MCRKFFFRMSGNLRLPYIASGTPGETYSGDDVFSPNEVSPGMPGAM